MTDHDAPQTQTLPIVVEIAATAFGIDAILRVNCRIEEGVTRVFDDFCPKHWSHRMRRRQLERRCRIAVLKTHSQWQIFGIAFDSRENSLCERRILKGEHVFAVDIGHRTFRQHFAFLCSPFFGCGSNNDLRAAHGLKLLGVRLVEVELNLDFKEVRRLQHHRPQLQQRKHRCECGTIVVQKSGTAG